MIKVKATKEGLVGHKTSSGYVIDKIVPFVALPSTKALNKFVRLRNPLNDKTCYAIVLDVGPWNIYDDNYVFGSIGQRPAAETGKDMFGRITNHAGIDLSDKVWQQLEMKDNTDIEWEFLE